VVFLGTPEEKLDHFRETINPNKVLLYYIFMSLFIEGLKSNCKY
jgi:hypothetical protein